MGYCDADDVSADTGFSYSDTSTPTDSEVGEYITEGAARIDILFSARGLSVPVVEADSPDLYQYARGMNRIYAASRAITRDENASERFWRMYQDMKSDIMAGTLDESDGDRESASPFDNTFYTTW